ncbi:nucleotidyl transferase AbiEii/AbiGii toxin family protein [Candidatus Woesearchaeota archaeon]|nr:nucleotidyl transferase AbiEii/AbiGii toxin family protein [Candidatus Woesearchaeota archaeon]
MENKIPLANRIKKESHRKIAFVQDLIVDEICKMNDKAVFHGGTCIWRCYYGNRFSDDLDFYFSKDKKLIEKIFESLGKKGFTIIKKKISDRSVYSEFEYNRISVRLEGTFQNTKGIIINYEKIDGTIITVYGLSQEQLIKEKVATYVKRKKIRDLYDVFFLLKLISNFDNIKNEIGILIKNYNPPVDESDLKVIILEGIIPSSEDIIAYIKRKWENPSI